MSTRNVGNCTKSRYISAAAMVLIGSLDISSIWHLGRSNRGIALTVTSYDLALLL